MKVLADNKIAVRGHLRASVSVLVSFFDSAIRFFSYCFFLLFLELYLFTRKGRLITAIMHFAELSGFLCGNRFLF